MTERTDLTTVWEESPRLVEVASPSTELINQDLHDTLKSLTEQASENDDSLDNMDDDPLIDSAGKENLGGGVSVGITSTLLNAQIAFESRLTPTSSGTATSADANGTLLTDTGATFVTDGVARGAVIINFNDESITEVLRVTGETTIEHRVLRAGTTNQWASSDSYKIWNIVQCDLSGGNLVAEDDIGDPLSPVFPTAFTQIVRTSSSSATLQELEEIQLGAYQGAVWLDTTNITGNAVSGTAYPAGTPSTPSDNTTDALAIANEKGFYTVRILGNLTMTAADDFTDFTFTGQSTTQTVMNVGTGPNMSGCVIQDVTLTGTLDGGSVVRNSKITTLNFVEGEVVSCLLENGTITLGGTTQADFLNCWSGVAGLATPIIDMNGDGPALALRNYNGGVQLNNKTGADNVSIDLNSGQVVLDSTVTNGTIVVRGIGDLTDNSVGATVNSGNLLQPDKVLTTPKFLALKGV